VWMLNIIMVVVGGGGGGLRLSTPINNKTGRYTIMADNDWL
jgi:hypothetical protein